MCKGDGSNRGNGGKQKRRAAIHSSVQTLRAAAGMAMLGTEGERNGQKDERRRERGNGKRKTR